MTLKTHGTCRAGSTSQHAESAPSPAQKWRGAGHEAAPRPEGRMLTAAMTSRWLSLFRGTTSGTADTAASTAWHRPCEKEPGAGGRGAARPPPIATALAVLGDDCTARGARPPPGLRACPRHTHLARLGAGGVAHARNTLRAARRAPPAASRAAPGEACCVFATFFARALPGRSYPLCTRYQGFSSYSTTGVPCVSYPEVVRPHGPGPGIFRKVSQDCRF